MKATRVWAALALAGLLIAGCQSSPSGGEGGTGAAPAATSGGDLKAMGAAMSKATAWHMSKKDKFGGMEMDIVCPDKMRVISKSPSGDMEAVHIGGAMYSRVGRQWLKQSREGQPPICGAGSGNVPDVPSASKKLTKGGTATVNGESCQEWMIESSLGSSTMCVGSDDLPRQTKTGDTTITYSNWNKPATIEAPKATIELPK